MTAKTAREVATKVYDEKIKEELDEILEEIKTAAEEGVFELTWSQIVEEKVVTILTTEPFLFKIEKKEDNRNGSYIVISW